MMLRRATSTTVPISEPEAPHGAPLASGPEAQRARVRAMFEAHHQLVWRSLRRYGLDAEAAADITQQAFVVALERVADIWPGRERAFLIGTALRLARSAQRMTARYCLDTQLEERLIQTAPHPEKSATTLELLDRVLAQLDDGLVEVFVLFDIEGMSGPELAHALGIPTGTVASRVRRAREAFRAAAQRVELTRAREESR
ncbi:MAG TPA: sigma-70 family RNA polymerase sigma factor [Polyangiales bacterium]|nr:sigma-70 family RNA polymerase sigma factor [Polyangiales bacterium]